MTPWVILTATAFVALVITAIGGTFITPAYNAHQCSEKDIDAARAASGMEELFDVI